MSTYYMETKRWKALTPEARKDIMEKFAYINKMSYNFPRGFLVREVFRVYPINLNAIYRALNLTVFNERILEHAYHVAHYFTDLSPAEQEATSLKDYVIARVTNLDDDDEW